MSKVELVTYLTWWTTRLALDESYEARKIFQLLNAYCDMVVSEMLFDAAMTDVNAGAYSCSGASCSQ